MARVSTHQLLQLEKTCGSLLYELQIIWDEVGESDDERDKMLLELEQECLEVYRRKVDQANRCRAQLRQAIADSEAELASICSSIGEPPVHTRQSNQGAGSLKEELKSIAPQLDEMRKKKEERLHQFLEVIKQIRKISLDISPTDCNPSKLAVDESDLSTKKLEDLYRQLESLQKEKCDRLNQVMEYLSALNALCSILGVDFIATIREIHPSLDGSEISKSVSNATIESLAAAIRRLREIKIERMQKVIPQNENVFRFCYSLETDVYVWQLQDLASTMLELWNLMDTPIEEQRLFQNVTSNIAASEEEITEPDTLSLDFLNYVEAEVLRLEELKISMMKELVLKKKTELEELRRRAHLVADAENDTEFVINAIESGAIDASSALEQIEAQISTVKDDAFSRKEILERVEKWLIACEEEAWLEEYNRDENRYNAGRGAHLSLKRAEKARALVNKIPAMVETLVAKITQWEQERSTGFIYDGVRLLSMLEEYTIVRQEKEQERKRQRDQKKLQGQLIAEQEALYGSKPSPSKPQSAKKVANRRLSLGGALLHPSKADYPHSAKPVRVAKRTDDLGTFSPSACHPVKKLSYNAHQEVGVPARKPFAPLVPVNSIPPTPSKVNSIPSTPLKANNIPSTPSKPITSAYGENRTPNTMLAAAAPTPKTPTTVPVPMHVATTPASTCYFNSEAVVAKVAVAQVEETEYSFEERRLSLYLSR
ncbi:65-kDa microtubule-associated protein 3-like [Canna indica]|uniref:65-kDa microtubule-associated protein 3-like n=1 Tax=Canna indica TaxID=4628 RepID=A0AAQ3KI65_9LILI|nr:65-kDa microtubule-associated protein 3-like [Canna indica]